MLYFQVMNRWFARSSLLLAMAFPVYALADSSSSSAANARAAARQSSSERALKQKLDDFQVDGIPFKDAISTLRDASGANFFVKWTALEQAGVDPETPVSVKVKGVTLAKALRLILDSAETEGIALGYYVHENVITISISHTQRTDLVTRVYDITDLMYRIPDLAPGNNGNSNGGTQNNGNGSGYNSGGNSMSAQQSGSFGGTRH